MGDRYHLSSGLITKCVRPNPPCFCMVNSVGGEDVGVGAVAYSTVLEGSGHHRTSLVISGRSE